MTFKPLPLALLVTVPLMSAGALGPVDPEARAVSVGTTPAPDLFRTLRDIGITPDEPDIWVQETGDAMIGDLRFLDDQDEVTARIEAGTGNAMLAELVAATAVIAGNGRVGGDLTVGGLGLFRQSLDVAGSGDLGGDLMVLGGGTFGGSLRVAGPGTFGSLLSAPSADVADLLTAGGVRVIGTLSAGALEVAGDVRFDGMLTGGAVPWARITGFPTGCGAGEAATGVGALLTCAPNPVWRRVYLDNFETDAGGWNFAQRGPCAGATILGGPNVLSGAVLERTFDLAAEPHSEVMVRLDYYFGDTWDNEWAAMRLDQREVWKVRHSRGAMDEEICGSIQGSADTIALVTAMAPNSESSLRVRVGAGLDQPPNDEWWGIDNVEVWVR